MIQITVISQQGVSVANPATAQFGPAGGTIGRAVTNTLVLDDPGRAVSRVHARVLCRDGRYFIVDQGSNPMQINGSTPGTGVETPLADGDQLMIGNFELGLKLLSTADAAAVPAAAANPDEDDPFTDLLAGLTPRPAPAPPPSASSEALPDPFAASTPVANTTALDPFAALSPASSSSAGGGGLLDDFGDLSSPAAQGASGIDNLFGPGGGGPGGDPLAGSPLADPLHQPNTAAGADPLAALAGTAPPTPAALSDHLPIGQFGFVPPQALAPEITAPAPATGPMPIAPPAAPPPAAPAADDLPAPSAAPRAGDDLLLAALLRGLQRLDPAPQRLTPALMERVGALLRAATEGTLHLLLARQQFKHELRATRTLIVAQDNNPLKFSPTVEIALAHLLGPGVRSFMPAEAAMRDAFNDLRAHQFGVMVGMRAALTQLIGRFAPAELEKSITAKSPLDNFFSTARKAKLWDQFVQLYSSIATEAEDDFHSFFGKAFVQAYEEQMARLDSAGHSGGETKR